MSAHNITDAFDDCINRIATGQSIEQCLRAYPQFADRLRPLLETSKVVQRLRITQSELLQDQDIVWQKMLQQSLSPKIMPIRRRRPPYQLLIAAVMLVLTMAVTVFMLSRPDLPPEEDDAIIATLTLETLVPDSSATSTATLTLTVTSTQTKTPTETPRVTLTVSPSPTATLTPTLIPTIILAHPGGLWPMRGTGSGFAFAAAFGGGAGSGFAFADALGGGAGSGFALAGASFPEMTFAALP